MGFSVYFLLPQVLNWAKRFHTENSPTYFHVMHLNVVYIYLNKKAIAVWLTYFYDRERRASVVSRAKILF